MAIPGRSAQSRLVAIANVNGVLLKRLGACRNGFTGGSSLAFVATITIDTIVLSPLLADSSGVMPLLIGNPNATVALSPHDSGLYWDRWDGTANCGPGTSRGTYTRLRFIGNDAYVIEQYVLLKLTDGSCAYLLVFSSGALGFATLAAGTPVTLPNRAVAGGVVSGILATAAGSVTVGLPS